MNVEPFFGKVIVSVNKPKDLGVFMLSGYERKKNKGRILSVAPKSSFKEGDLIHFIPKSGLKIDETKSLIEEKDIILTLNKHNMKVHKVHGERVLVSQEVGSNVTDAGIVIPDSIDRKLPMGTITMVGEEVKNFKEGDLIMFSPDSGTEVEVDGKVLLLLETRNIWITYSLKI
jgi:co-chaperonin GroES (HSP10)